ncbi:F-box/kelch-repeat protein At3g06240-like isoform X1 [Rosa rugosa]|uniref:F-box/kelch-repeat protein At3g06240-like isoform X1 n=1 Tax=Rosa rugosa TaxID=74645 RepID=UPI002B411B02|nr:F-box/kelch-repeat protein At3g06240-like isoform X1 [Rosa rugosa]
MRRNKCKKSSSSSSSSSSTISSVSYIPEEILIDILARLPAESLLRFRCVSQSWRGLIGSPSFVSKHLNRNVTKLSHTYLIALQRLRDKPALCHSLFSTETFEECLKLRHPLWTEEQFRIYGSSNGLVCISDQVLRPSSPICIWNPCIRKFRTLPQSIFKPHYSSYDISLSFGFHPELNDYRVVTMGWYVRSVIKVQVYSLSTGSWKMIEVIPPWLKFNPDWCQGCAFFNGVAYWLFTKSKKFRFVSFDTDSEEFEEIIVPDTISTKGFTYVGVYNGLVCLFYSYLEGPDCQKPQKYMDIWVLKEQSFTKLHTAVLLPGRDYLPLGFSIQNELIAKDKKHTKGDEGDTGQMVLYDLEMKLIKKTGISLAHDSHYKTSAGTYIESLVLLNR